MNTLNRPDSGLARGEHMVIENESTKKTDADLETTICDLIVKQMQKHPEKIAIIDGETKIKYRDLLKRAGEVTGELRNRSVEPGSLVGVCMNRTWELVAA